MLVRGVSFSFESFEDFFGLCFLRSVHTFSRFLKSICSSDFGHAETGNGARKRVVLLTCDNFALTFNVFRFFWIGFSKWFSQSIDNSF